MKHGRRLWQDADQYNQFSGILPVLRPAAACQTLSGFFYGVNEMVVKTEVLTVPQIVEAMVAKDGQAFASSRAIAEHFGKRHDSVLRSIVNLTNEDGCTRHNFVVSEYRDSSGRQCTEYLMDKDACVLLIMGFTGKAALQFKYAYIAAFNAMAERLANQSPPLPPPPANSHRTLEQELLSPRSALPPSLRDRSFSRSFSFAEAALMFSSCYPNSTVSKLEELVLKLQWVKRDSPLASPQISDDAINEGFLAYRQNEHGDTEVHFLSDGLNAMEVVYSGI